MFVPSRHRRLHAAVFAAAAVFSFGASDTRLAADTRKVSADSLVYDLNHPDPMRRQAAARALGIDRVKTATPKLVALAHDPVPAVRREVELALEAMEDPQSLPGFIAFSTDMEDDIRARAVAALVNLHLSRPSIIGAAFAKVNELITPGPDPDLDLVIEPDLPVDPLVVDSLRGRLVDSERGIRKTAIRGLGILQARPAVPDLLRVVREDRDDGLRFEGVRSLRKIGDASVAEQLTSLLNVNSDTVRNELMATIGVMRYRGAVAELTRIVEQAPKTDTPRIVALAALADIADPASEPLFERLRADRSESIRLYAYEGVARTVDPNWKTMISAERLTEKSARVRMAQAFALLHCGESEYLDELIRGLERANTRDLAKEYLVETQPSARPALFTAHAATPAARAHLADVLGQMGDPAALPALQEMARDSDENVARAAQRAVKRMGAAGTQ